MMSIMSNEMRRQLEVLDHDLKIEEKIMVIDKYTVQLVNSSYNFKQIHDIIVSALLGFVRREKRKGILIFWRLRYFLWEYISFADSTTTVKILSLSAEGP